MIFCMASTQPKEEWEGKKRKKIKAISGQTTPKHHIYAT
jgi:hypothetical protein